MEKPWKMHENNVIVEFFWKFMFSRTFLFINFNFSEIHYDFVSIYVNWGWGCIANNKYSFHMADRDFKHIFNRGTDRRQHLGSSIQVTHPVVTKMNFLGHTWIPFQTFRSVVGTESRAGKSKPQLNVKCILCSSPMLFRHQALNGPALKLLKFPTKYIPFS